MDADIKIRIGTYMSAKGISINGLVKTTGIPQPTLQKQLKGSSALSGRVLEAICAACPDLSAEWLLRGEGTMYLHKTEGKTYNIYRTGGDGDGQTNVVGEGNDVSPENNDTVKMLLQQNAQLINALINGK